MITKELETKFGKAILSVISDCEAAVESRQKNGGFAINGIKVLFSVRLNLIQGKWTCDTRYLYSYRSDFKKVTVSANKKLVVEVERVVTEYITAKPQVLFDAETSIINDRRKKLQELIILKKQELQELEHELCSLEIVQEGEPFIV